MDETMLGEKVPPFVTDDRLAQDAQMLIEQAGKLELRVATVTGLDGSRRLAYLQVSPLLPKSVPLPLPILDRLAFERSEIGSQDIDRLVSEVRRGTLTTQKEILGVPAGKNLIRWHRKTRWNMREEHGVDWAAYELKASESENGLQESVEELDSRLTSATPPYGSFAEVLSDFVDLADLNETPYGFDRRQSRIMIFVQVPIRLSTCKLDGPDLILRADTLPYADPAECVLSYIAHHEDGRVERQTMTGTSLKSDGDGRWQHHASLRANPLRVRVYVSYRGTTADEITLSGRPAKGSHPRLQAIGATMGLPDLLIKKAQEAKGRIAEAYVAGIFTLGPFAAYHAGGVKSSGGDLLVFPEHGRWMFLVECTDAEPDHKGKLSKLATRAAELRDAADLEVFPILVSQTPNVRWTGIAHDAAAQDGIALIGPSQLERIAEMGIEREPARSIVDYIHGHVPRRPGAPAQTGLIRGGGARALEWRMRE